jgi:uncharacterized membrane protein
MENSPLITNDAIVLGILMIILAFVFRTSHSSNPFWKRFYTYVPSLLLCYFLPSLLSTAGIISGDASNLYFVASRYLLPTSLVLLTLSIDLPAILRLGPKALIMFLTGTTGIVVGGPLAIFLVSLVSPETVGMGTDEVWRGMTTVAGSWIGGGANQTAMKEVFQVGDDIFSALVAVDVIVANIWMAFLLYAAGRSQAIDRSTGADTSAIEELRQKVEDYHASIARIPSLTDLMTILGVGFGATAFAHLCADAIAPFLQQNYPQLERLSLTSPFFWLVVVATTLGLVFSNHPKTRELEGAGASRVGSALLYVLVASIGMKMNLRAIFEHTGLFVVGGIWLAFHALLLITVARLIKAPVFFLAVGSQANVGGAASAPIVASAFHPALAPVGVLLAVFGYALGTYAAWFCGILMQAVAT